MKKETILSIIIMVMVLAVIGVTIFISLKDMNKTLGDYEKKCQRISIDNETDNCMCPCDEPNWIEKKLHLTQLCDGWIVKKNESCISSLGEV